MTPALEREVVELIEANRDRALWSLAPDFMPQTPEATRRVLRLIAARGDRTTYVHARQLVHRLDEEQISIANSV